MKSRRTPVFFPRFWECVCLNDTPPTQEEEEEKKKRFVLWGRCSKWRQMA